MLTMNPRTGAGVFGTALVDGIQKTTGARVKILTSEDLLSINKLKLLWRLPRIRRVLSGCDIVHALDGYPYGIIAWLALIGTGKPLVVTAIGTGAIQKLSHVVYGRLLSLVYRAARVVTAPSAYVASYLERVVTGLRVEVISHGIDFSAWQAPITAQLSESLKGKKYILSVGAIKRRKGYHLSLRAFARVAHEMPELHYVVVGNPLQSPSYFRELELIMEELSIGDRVVFLHGLSFDELRAVYNAAELFVLLSMSDGGDVEGFGLVFLEAAAMELPVIGSAGTGAEDAIWGGHNGFAVIDPSDDGDVAERMKMILTDESARTTMSRASHEFASKMQWEHQIKKYEALYSKLLP